MKKSIYNYIVKYESVFLLYNTLSASLVELDQEEYERYLADCLSDDELMALIKNGMFVDEGKDELSVVNQRRCNYLNSHDELIYRVFTTTKCNAKCYYCFEKGVIRSDMTETTAARVVDFIASEVNKNNPKRLKINWFGGEPLVNENIIGYITKELREKTDVETKYSIVTNGSLLSENSISRIVNDYDIKQVQITLDGYGETYESIKQYDDSRLSFDRIIENIRILLEHKAFVTIRIHYVQSMYESIDRLIDYLGEIFPNYKNLYVYLSPLWNVCSVGNSPIFIESQFSRPNYTDYLSLMKKIVQYGLASEKNTLKLVPRYGQCMACKKDNFNILPNGDLIKCAEVMFEKIGNVSSGINSIKNANWEFKELNQECSECVFLPMCQGGCRASYFSDMERCFKNKPIIDDLIIWKYKMHS